MMSAHGSPDAPTVLARGGRALPADPQPGRGEVQRGIDTSITLLSLFTTRRSAAAPHDDGNPRGRADAAAREASRAGSKNAVFVAARLIQSIPSHWGARHLLI